MLCTCFHTPPLSIWRNPCRHLALYGSPSPISKGFSASMLRTWLGWAVAKGSLLSMHKVCGIASGPRFYILWDMARLVLEEMVLAMPPLGELVINVSFQAFPHAFYVCNSTSHFARDCSKRRHREQENNGEEEAERGKQEKTPNEPNQQVMVFRATEGRQTDNEGFVPVRNRRRQPRRARLQPQHGTESPRTESHCPRCEHLSILSS